MEKMADMERFMNNTILKRIDLMEQTIDGQASKASQLDNKHRQTMQRTAKIEDTLIEHIDII